MVPTPGSKADRRPHEHEKRNPGYQRRSVSRWGYPIAPPLPVRGWQAAGPRRAAAGGLARGAGAQRNPPPATRGSVVASRGMAESRSRRRRSSLGAEAWGWHGENIGKRLCLGWRLPLTTGNQGLDALADAIAERVIARMEAASAPAYINAREVARRLN